MKQDSWETSNSFAETAKLVENFARQEIARETKEKQLYYHTVDHAIAVKRRANYIFHAIKFTLSSSQSPVDLDRLESLITIGAIAHDMVQQFSVSEAKTPRKRVPGVSEVATANKLINYLKNLNKALSVDLCDPAILFRDEDLATIEDAILATICDRDPQAGKAPYSFSAHSIYQPYLYNSQPKISIAGKIIALADLGTLGIDGVEPFIREGILVFLEDNLDIKSLILHCDYPSPSIQAATRSRLLNMARFIVNLAEERKARFELEISGFFPKARKVLREEVFVHLNQENVEKIKATIPTSDNASLEELVDFFCSNNIA